MSIKTLLGAENPKKPYFFSTVKDFENGCFSQIMTKFHEKKLLNYDEKEEVKKFAFMAILTPMALLLLCYFCQQLNFLAAR